MLKNLFIGGLLAVAMQSVMAGKAGPIKGDWQAEQVVDDVYVIHGPLETPNPQNQGFMNNPGFILTPAGVVVVDPGGSVQVGEMLLDHIAKVTDMPVVAVFNTHIHGDHWLGNDAIAAKYPEAKIYGHPEMIKGVENGSGDEWMVMAMRMTDGAVAGTEVVNATDAADNGDSIEIGGVTFNVYHNGLAHTHTDIMIHVPEKKVMFLGDNAAVYRLLRNEGSVKGNIEALDEAIAVNTDIFVPGHGPSGNDSAAMYRNYLKMVYKQVRVQYDEGLSDFEMKPVIAPKLNAYKDWSDFDRLLGKHINKIYMEVEADSF